MVDIIGALASILSFVLWLPQARLVWANRGDAHALASVSLGTQLMVLANAALWAVYGALTSAFWVAAPGLVNGPLSLMTIYLVLRSREPRRRGRNDEGDPPRMARV